MPAIACRFVSRTAAAGPLAQQRIGEMLRHAFRRDVGFARAFDEIETLAEQRGDVFGTAPRDIAPAATCGPVRRESANDGVSAIGQRAGKLAYVRVDLTI